MRDNNKKLLFFHENFVLGGDTTYLETILKGILPDEFLLVYGGSSSVTKHIQNSGLNPSSLKKFNSYSYISFKHMVLNDNKIPPKIKLMIHILLKLFSPLFNILLSVRLKIFLKTLQMEDFNQAIINSGGFYGTKCSRFFFQNIGVKCTYILHNHIPAEIIRDKRKFLTVSKYVSNWIVGSKYIKKQLVDMCGVDKTCVHLIYYGVKPSVNPRDIDRSKVRTKLKIPQNSYVLLHPSVFEKRKGHYFTITAFRDIKYEISNSKLLLAGSDGYDRGYLEKLIVDLGVVEDVIFTGFYKPLEELIMASDVLCLPTQHFDTTPQVILLALACGVPVLTTKREDFDEILFDEFNALLVPTNDYKTIIEKISKLYKNESLKKKLIENGLRTYNEHFTEKKMVESTVNLLRNI